MSYVNRAEDIPVGEHWAIIRSSSFYIPDDQRSIDAPGHGYPARNEPYITYQVFATYEDFHQEFTRLLNSATLLGRETIRGVHVKGTYTGKVDYKGVLDDKHMRVSRMYPTRLHNGVEVHGHTDYDCLKDAEAAGFLRFFEDANAVVFTPQGWSFVHGLRRGRADAGANALEARFGK